MIGIGPASASCIIVGTRLASPPPEPVPVNATVAAVVGQSENVVGWLSNSTESTANGIYPAVLPGVDMEVMIPRAANEGALSHGIYTVTQANADQRKVSPGAVAIGNLWHLGSGGVPLRLVGLCVSGTGMLDLLDDAMTARSFAEDLAMVRDAETAWGPVSRVTYNWYVAEAAAAKTLWESRAPHVYGINADGSPYDYATGTIDHCLIDTTGRGYGMFGAFTRFDLMYPGNYIDFAAQGTFSPPCLNYTTDGAGAALAGRVVSNGAPTYAERRDFVIDSPEANRGIVTVSPALAVMGDYEGGIAKTGRAQVSSHPALQTKYGQVLYSQSIGFSLLCSYGFAQPTRLTRTEVASDGAHVDFVFALPAGASLSTQRIKEGLTVAAPRPHQQQVVGFSIARAGDTLRSQRPVYRTDNTDAALYPVAYRGTVTIHDAGTDGPDGREGVVRVVPQIPFANNDVVHFGSDGSYGGFILQGYRDYDARLALDGLRAYEPRLDDGTAYGFPGAPVVNQESMTVNGVGGVAPPAHPRVTKASGTQAYLQGPNIAAGVTGVTMLFRGAIGVQTTTGYQQYIGTNSDGIALKFDARTGQRAAQIRMEDFAGATIFANNYGAGSIPPAGETFTALITGTQDDGTGTARFALYINGGLVGSVLSAPAGASPTFPASQAFDALKAAGAGVTVERITVWQAYSPTGAEPATDLVADHSGPASYWNGTGLPSGWTSQGTGLWADQ